jgi:hypothetical protein
MSRAAAFALLLHRGRIIFVIHQPVIFRKGWSHWFVIVCDGVVDMGD